MLPDYEPSEGRVLQMLQAIAGNAVGDPAKVADVVRDLAHRESVPAHLLLGSDAVFVAETAEATRQKEAADWAEVSRSTDFEGLDLSLVPRRADEALILVVSVGAPTGTTTVFAQLFGTESPRLPCLLRYGLTLRLKKYDPT
jgi:hypothetical protein